MYIIIGFSLLKDITQDSLAKDMLKCSLLYCLYKCTLSTLIYVFSSVQMGEDNITL